MVDYSNGKDVYGARFSDEFKYQHKKQLPNGCYASDLDLVLLSKYPPGPVAIIDYKFPNEPLTFAEVLLYNAWAKYTPIFLVLSDKPQIGPFTIKRYKCGDWQPDPPTVEYYENVRVLPDWEAFKEWEISLRRFYEQNNGWASFLNNENDK